MRQVLLVPLLLVRQVLLVPLLLVRQVLLVLVPQLELQLELQFFLRSQQKRLSLRQREEGKTFSLL